MLKETEKPFGFIILDNHPRTTNENQVVADVFGHCYTYPHITNGSSQNIHLPQSVPEVNEQPTPTVKRKVNHQVPTAKKQTVKRIVDHQVPTAKKQKNSTVKRKVDHTVKRQKTQAVKSKPTKKSKKQSKRKTKKQTVYQSKERFTNGFQEEEQVNSDEEQLNYDSKPLTFEEELPEIARREYETKQMQRAFGPRFA